MKNIFYTMVINVSLFSYSLNAQWVQINDLNEENISSLAVFKDKEGRNNLLAGTGGPYTYGGVYLSTNDGLSWIKVDSGLTDIGIWCLAVSHFSNETEGSNIFAGTWGGGVYLSTDDGISWAKRDSGLMYGFVNNITISRNESNGFNIFVETSNYWGTERNIFFSNNNGTTWEALFDSNYS